MRRYDMKLFIMTALVTSFVGMTVFAETDEEKGERIAREIEKANDGFKGESSGMEMILINAHGDKIARKMEGKIMEQSGDGDRSITIFKYPKDVAGTKMLTWTHKKKDDDQWLYLPSIKRVKRISSRNKSGSFMGSEFSYEDLGSQEPEKYQHKFLADEKLNGRSVWKIQRIPMDKNSGYSKQILWTDKEYNGALKMEYYDRRGSLLKVAEFKDYKKFGKFFRPSSIHVVNKQTKKESIISWTNRKLNKKFPKSVFQSSALKDDF